MVYAQRIFGLLLVAVFLIPAPRAVAQQEAMTPPRLTEDQIERFFNSYPALHTMAKAYWGKRKYTPTHKMLEPQGTFERAFSEMEWSGKLPDFDNLVQSYGFDGRETWINLAYRISHAYVILRLQQKNPKRAETWRKARIDRMANIEQERQKAETLPDGIRAQRLEMFRQMENELERERLAEIDADALKPFYARFKEMDRYLIPEMK